MRLFLVIFVLLMLVLGYIDYLNPSHVTLRLTQTSTLDISVAGLVLFSIAFGGLFVIFSAGVRETKNLFLNWKFSRQQKKENKIQEMYTHAVNTFLSKKNKEAIGLFQRILVLKPNHVDSLLRLGNAFRIEKNFNESVRLHRKAKGLDEQNREILFALSRDYEESGRFEEAVGVLKEAVALQESDLQALTKLRDVYILLGKWEEAHALQEKILKNEGDFSSQGLKDAHDLLLGLKYEVGKGFLENGELDHAKKYFKSAFKMEKNFLPAYIGLGEVLINENKVEEAGEFWEKAFILNGHHTLLFRIEDLYLEMGQPTRIIGFYQSIVRRDPSNIVNKFYLGKLYFRLEMIDDAYNLLISIENYEGRFPDLYKLLGLIYARKGFPAKAVEAFKKALHLKESVKVPYYCPLCDYHTVEWSGRCHRCGRWNSYTACPILEETSSDTENPIMVAKG
ncbi:MAG: tetratricopeptide repeat protein [Nitrospirae bacterium]|nr:tetratricopeptide repeat protein [Nitrospirota bacterium]MBI3595134.1 tetratricopeptide repeat protein [Nitrospirota bacterium]